MTDESLARDGYSERPPLLRALALALVSFILALTSQGLFLVFPLLAGAGVEYFRFSRRRRERLSQRIAR
jgi:hypothetical protein